MQRRAPLNTTGNGERTPGAAPEQAAVQVRGATRNSALARRKLLDAADLLISRHGFKATSTEQIAGLAGYSQATLFFHFKTKLGILEACLDDALERAIAALPQASSRGTLHLLDALDTAFHDLGLADFFARLLMEQAGNPLIQPVYAAFRAHIRDLIEAELAVETGASPARLTEAAATIQCMLIGVHAAHRVESSVFDRARYRDMLLTVTTMVIDSLHRGGSASVAPFQGLPGT
jgi:AcrR family transcriptional regulator